MSLFSRSMMYWFCFIVPWTKYRRPEPFPDITDQIITEAGCLTVETVPPVPNFRLYVISQTPLCPSDTWMLIRQKAYLKKVQYFLSKWKIKESNFNHVIFYTLFRVTCFFQSSKWSHFFFIAIVNRGFLDGRWHLKSCSYNLRWTVLSDTAKSWVFTSFVIWSMLIFMFCLQKFTIFLSTRGEVFFFAPHFLYD